MAARNCSSRRASADARRSRRRGRAAGRRLCRSLSARRDARGASPLASAARPRSRRARGKPISTKQRSGRSSSAAAIPASPSAASCTSWPSISSSVRSVCRASTLSSMTSSRRDDPACVRLPVQAAPCRRVTTRKAKNEGAAAIDAAAVRFDGAAVQLREPANEREPNPRPPSLRSRPCCPCDERLEYVRQELRANAEPLILDPQLGDVADIAHSHANTLVRRRVLQRVADQVLHDLRDSHGVGFDPHRLERQLDAPCAKAARRNERIHAAPDGAGELQGLCSAGSACSRSCGRYRASRR